MKKMIFIAAGASLLIAAIAGTAFFVLNGDPAAPDVAGAMPETDAEPKEVFYYNIHPEFVVNFDGKPRARFLMVEMAISTFDGDVPAVIDDHVPELRNNLLMVLAEQDIENLATNDGKTALRALAKTAVEELVAKYHAPDAVEDVFLTRFVIQ